MPPCVDVLGTDRCARYLDKCGRTDDWREFAQMACALSCNMCDPFLTDRVASQTALQPAAPPTAPNQQPPWTLGTSDPRAFVSPASSDPSVGAVGRHQTLQTAPQLAELVSLAASITRTHDASPTPVNCDLIVAYNRCRSEPALTFCKAQCENVISPENDCRPSAEEVAHSTLAKAASASDCKCGKFDLPSDFECLSTVYDHTSLGCQLHGVARPNKVEDVKFTCTHDPSRTSTYNRTRVRFS